jgi:hypothetical protein
MGWLLDARHDGDTWPRRFAGYQEDNGSLESTRRAWLRALEDTGLQPGALPLARLDAAATGRFPLLVLPRLLCLDAADVERLERHLAAGGSLVVDGPLGSHDRGGRLREESVLPRLTARAPGRVHLAPRGLESYGVDRLAPDTSAAASTREAVRALWSGAGATGTPWRVAGPHAERPWLTAWTPDGRGGGVGVLIPNLQRAPERAEHLDVRSLELELDPGLAVEWIHPASPRGPAADLAPGDAAVFRLVPDRARARD